MDKADILGAVVAAVAEATEFPADDLSAHLDADLVADLGVDSLKMMEVWVGVESRLGLDLGDVAAWQPSTIRSMSEFIEKRALA